MKYIKLFEHTYSMYDLITMPMWEATELLFDEIKKTSPDAQFISDLLEYSKIYVNWQDSTGGMTALMWASQEDHTEIVKLLLERPDIDVNLQTVWGDTALMLASIYGHSEIVKLLLERPEIKVNLQNIYDSTALTRASRNEQIKVVELLLERPEIDVNLQDRDGRTAWGNAKTSIRELFPQLKPN